MRRKIYPITLLFLIGCSGILPILGLQGSQNIPSYGTVNYPTTNPIFLAFVPNMSLTESMVCNFVSSYQDLTDYFDVTYYLQYWHWNGNKTRLEEILNLFNDQNANVAILEIHGWKSNVPESLCGKKIFNSLEISSLKASHDNLVGMCVKEYLTAFPDNSTIIHRLESVLQDGEKNNLWVTVENEWWTWGYWEPQRINFTAIDSLFKRYSDIVIPITKTNGAIQQYLSWGACLGYHLSYGCRWGIDHETWYWYEIGATDYREGETLESPVDLFINTALYALMHNASFITNEVGFWAGGSHGKPFYFHEVDGTGTWRLDVYKEALKRYYDNGAPKTNPRVGILNLPFYAEQYPTDPYVSIDEQAMFRLAENGLDRSMTAPALTWFKEIYDLEYDAEGLINTKILIPILPYNTSKSLMSDFDFLFVAMPNTLIGATSGSTYYSGTSVPEVYDYLYDAAQVADLYIPHLLLLATDIGSFGFINHTLLTGFKPPYTQYSKSFGPGITLSWNHSLYARNETVDGGWNRWWLGTKLDNVVCIATLDGKSYVYQYTNDYGHKIYTDVTDRWNSKWPFRHNFGRFFRNITRSYMNYAEDSGLILYHIEYNESRFPDVEDRDPIIYTVNSTSNYALYAPFNHSEGKCEVTLSPNNSYAIVKENESFGNIRIIASSYPITQAHFHAQVLNATFKSSEESSPIVKIYCGIYGKPVSILGASTWSYNEEGRMLTVNVKQQYGFSSIEIRWQ